MSTGELPFVLTSIDPPEIELRPGAVVRLYAPLPMTEVAPLTILPGRVPGALYAVRDERAREFVAYAKGQPTGRKINRQPGYTFDVLGERGDWLIAWRSTDGTVELLTRGFACVDKRFAP